MKPVPSNLAAAPRGAARKPVEAAVPPEGTLLFITGWPACGIAECGSWLAQRRGYRHLDLDDPHPADAVWRDAWYRLLPEGAGTLVQKFLAESERWVVTAETPADHLPHLAALQEAGFGLWFLQARMEGHSRQRWLARERELDPAVKPAGWEKLADAIRRNARSLRPHFRNRCVESLSIEGPVDFETLAATMGVPGPRS